MGLCVCVWGGVGVSDTDRERGTWQRGSGLWGLCLAARALHNSSREDRTSCLLHKAELTQTGRCVACRHTYVTHHQMSSPPRLCTFYESHIVLKTSFLNDTSWHVSSVPRSGSRSFALKASFFGSTARPDRLYRGAAEGRGWKTVFRLMFPPHGSDGILE